MRDPNWLLHAAIEARQEQDMERHGRELPRDWYGPTKEDDEPEGQLDLFRKDAA